MNYPFAQGSSLTDAFSGNAYTTLVPMPIPTTGTISATVDGTGTLKLSSTVTLNNVIRYKIVEDATADAGFVSVDINRTQYEYYDLANSSLPVLVHSQLTIDGGSQNLVMSSVAPDEYLALSKNNKATFGVYPNPANESVLISGLSGNETVSIIDMAGRTILTAQNAGTSQAFNVSDIQAGIYTVVVLSNGNATTKKLTIN